MTAFKIMQILWFFRKDIISLVNEYLPWLLGRTYTLHAQWLSYMLFDQSYFM